MYTSNLCAQYRAENQTVKFVKIIIDNIGQVDLTLHQFTLTSPLTVSQSKQSKTMDIQSVYQTGSLFLCSFINYRFIVAPLPGWLPKLPLAQTLPYPHVATHCRFKMQKKKKRKRSTISLIILINAKVDFINKIGQYVKVHTLIGKDLCCPHFCTSVFYLKKPQNSNPKTTSCQNNVCVLYCICFNMYWYAIITTFLTTVLKLGLQVMP